jgi:hypothetical protein
MSYFRVHIYEVMMLMDLVENISFFLYSVVAVETCFFAEPLLRNGCFIVAYFCGRCLAAVYMPQYIQRTIGTKFATPEMPLKTSEVSLVALLPQGIS